MIAYKRRRIDRARPVEVYRNLRCARVDWPVAYSIRQDGLVVAHAERVSLVGCEFVVRDGGRQRVIATGVKNVHAWVRGTLTDQVLHYDPRKFISFVRDRDPLCPVRRAERAVIGPHGILVSGWSSW